MKWLKYILILLVIGAGIGFYLYNKPHQNMEKASIDIRLDAEAFFQMYENDETAADAKYLDKIVAVSGTVRDFSQDEEGNATVTLSTDNDMFGVICKMDELSPEGSRAFNIGEEVSLKGICTGMLMDIVLVRCVEI